MPEILQVKSPEPSRKINWKNILITVVVLVLLIGGGVGIWILLKQPSTQPPSQTSIATSSAEKDETANWKTFTSKDNNYTIKYPNNWKRYDSLSIPSFSEKDPLVYTRG